MLNLPLRLPQLAGPLILTAVVLLLQWLEPVTQQWLAYDRVLVQQHQWWRLLSGNLMHTNWHHLILNLAGLWLLWALHGDYYRPRRYLSLLAGASIGCAVGLFVFAPNMVWYVGLSGALHGLFVWGACYDVRHGMKSGWWLLVGVTLKLLLEQTQGASPQLASVIEASVAVDAHLFGSISGLVLALPMLFAEKNDQLADAQP